MKNIVRRLRVRPGGARPGWLRVVLLPFLLAFVAAGTLAGAGSAQAAAPAKEPVAVGAPTTVKIPMMIKGSGDATTDTTGRGNCGLIYLTIVPTGGGTVRFEYGFESSLGVVAQRTARVTWANASAGVPAINVFEDSGFMISSRFDGTHPGTTGAGRIIANFDLVILHYNLTACVGFVQDVNPLVP